MYWPVPPGFCDSAIDEFIAKSSKLHNFRKSSQIFVIAADFLQILGLDTSRDVIATCIQSKKGCFSVWKMKWITLRSHHARFTRATLAQNVYLLVSCSEPQAALDPATPLYSAGRYCEESSRIHCRINNISDKSCEKHSNYVKATDIRTNATDVETRKNTNLHHSPWIYHNYRNNLWQKCFPVFLKLHLNYPDSTSTSERSGKHLLINVSEAVLHAF